MVFEIGKYYQHGTGSKMAVLCEAETTVWGNALIAETNEGDLVPVGKSEEHAINWHEISKDDWMKSFSE